MHLRMALTLLAAFSYATFSSPVLAEQGSSKATKDPNEKICENLTQVGSRLAVRRVCATRAEWAESRRLDREAIDQAQRSACQPTTTGSTGRPAC